MADRNITPPFVSVIVPVRNEENRILATSIRSFLTQRYSDFEIIVVDDRSTDGTLGILQNLSAENPRLIVIQGTEPPPDWLGKVFALEQAVQHARGEWIAAVDGDVLMHPDALRALVNLALGRNLAVVALEIDPDWVGAWAKLVTPAAGLIEFLTLRLMRTNDPESDYAVASGAFTLIQRTALEGIGGFGAVKGRLPEGKVLVELIKKAGYRIHSDWIPGFLRTPSYASLTELWRAYSLVAYQALDLKLRKAMGLIILDVFAFVLPGAIVSGQFAAFAMGLATPNPPILLPALLAYGIMVAVYIPVYRNLRVAWPMAFLAFFAHAILVAILCASIFRHVLGRRATWRGRQI
jgi:glycosyltransferase involved in cell wall biosynthesis